MPTPEFLLRQQTDQLLSESDWKVQERGGINLYSSLGMAVREFLVKRGFGAHMLFMGRRLESARAVEAGLKRAGRLRQAVLRAAFEGRS